MLGGLGFEAGAFLEHYDSLLQCVDLIGLLPGILEQLPNDAALAHDFRL